VNAESERGRKSKEMREKGREVDEKGGICRTEEERNGGGVGKGGIV